ncbi:Protein of unknown function [Gryllus bimaculatus]|nr:Protein of unknown function [Gryllus bimaculatus]
MVSACVVVCAWPFVTRAVFLLQVGVVPHEMASGGWDADRPLFRLTTQISLRSFHQLADYGVLPLPLDKGVEAKQVTLDNYRSVACYLATDEHSALALPTACWFYRHNNGNEHLPNTSAVRNWASRTLLLVECRMCGAMRRFTFSTRRSPNSKWWERVAFHQRLTFAWLTRSGSVLCGTSKKVDIRRVPGLLETVRYSPKAEFRNGEKRKPWVIHLPRAFSRIPQQFPCPQGCLVTMAVFYFVDGRRRAARVLVREKVAVGGRRKTRRPVTCCRSHLLSNILRSAGFVFRVAFCPSVSKVRIARGTLLSLCRFQAYDARER